MKEKNRDLLILCVGSLGIIYMNVWIAIFPI